MKRSSIILISILSIVALYLIWYSVSPLFLNKTVNEEAPLISIDSTKEEVISYIGSFSGADSFHQVEGSASVVPTEGKKYLRLENFKSTNGPDLRVYLSRDIEASDYISLGELKGNIGNQNYEIPSNVDLQKYKYALIWCEQFSVLFGHAQLSSPVGLK